MGILTNVKNNFRGLIDELNLIADLPDVSVGYGV